MSAAQARRAPLRRPPAGRPLRVKMISPAKTAADSRYWRSIKYSLFPPLGLATLAGYLDPDDEIDLQDEHVETLRLDDEPDLVVIEAYITSAGRAYRYADHYRAKGAYVCLGGLHPTSLPEEAARHADSVFCGPGEDTWPAFLADFRAGRPKPLYRSTERTLAGMPPARRDLIKRERYLVPNSLVVSRGCPHTCDFCYKEAFFRGGKSFYVQAVDDALAEIDRLPGRHLYFLDDNLFGSPPFAEALFDGLKGMGRLWQAAGTVDGVLRPGLLEKAVESGLRSLFIGFETLSEANLRGAGKTQNLAGNAAGLGRGGASGAPLGLPQYDAAVRRLHDLGVMVNGAFVFGMDADDTSVFPRTVEWAVSRGIETATFHIMTPYPGTRLERRLAAEGRITSRDWDRYDTRHAVFTPARHDGGAARGRLLGRLPRVLPLAQHLARVLHPRRPARARPPPRLHQRLEEAGADVGLGDPQRPGAPLPAAAGGGPRPLRQRRRGDAGAARAAVGRLRGRSCPERRDQPRRSRVRLSDALWRYTPNRLCSD